jgi:MGT family glycosyltransferase
MAHIAFCVVPFAGHLNPTLGTSAELVSRGHRVSFLSTDRYQAQVEATGASPLLYETTMGTGDGGMGPYSDPDRITTPELAKMLRILLAETVATLPQWARLLGRDRPDLIVYDAPSCWSGRLLATMWGIPAVRSQVSLISSSGWSLSSAGYFDVDPESPELRTVIGGYDRLLAKLGIAGSALDMMTHDHAPAVAFVPRAFQVAGDTFSSDVHFVGPSPSYRPAFEPWQPPDLDRPLAFVSLGTVHSGEVDFFRTCIEAFEDQSWRLVIALGGRTDPAALGPVPSTVEIRDFVPHHDVLRHADVFVNHGGMGGVMDSILHEVPMVIVPQMAEDRAIADRIVDLGLGRHMHSDDCKPAAIRDVIIELTSDASARTALTAMRAEIEGSGGVAAAADVIERVLA